MNHVTPDAGALTKRTPTQYPTNKTNRHKQATRDRAGHSRQTNSRAGTPRRAQQNTPPKNKETPQPHPTGTVTGHPVIAYAPAPPRTETTPSPNKGIARSRPARSNTGSGQTVDKREIPEYPQREHPPTRRDNHANTVQTRKREKPTPRPPEQRRGSPNRQEREPQRTAEESNPTHNHVSEPISSRTQQPCWITVQKEGNKTAIEHAWRATRTRAPTAKRRTPTPHGRHQPLGYTPQCRPQHAHTRTRIKPFRFPQYQSRDSNSHAQPGTRF